MLLMEDEILDSVRVLVEEAFTTTIFQVTSVSGLSLLVYDSHVVQLISDMIRFESKSHNPLSQIVRDLSPSPRCLQLSPPKSNRKLRLISALSSRRKRIKVWP